MKINSERNKSFAGVTTRRLFHTQYQAADSSYPKMQEGEMSRESLGNESGDLLTFNLQQCRPIVNLAKPVRRKQKLQCLPHVPQDSANRNQEISGAAELKKPAHKKNAYSQEQSTVYRHCLKAECIKSSLKLMRSKRKTTEYWHGRQQQSLGIEGIAGRRKETAIIQTRMGKHHSRSQLCSYSLDPKTKENPVSAYLSEDERSPTKRVSDSTAGTSHFPIAQKTFTRIEKGDMSIFQDGDNSARE